MKWSTACSHGLRRSDADSTARHPGGASGRTSWDQRKQARQNCCLCAANPDEAEEKGKLRALGARADTRELARKVETAFRDYSRFMTTEVGLVHGGVVMASSGVR
jgi:hypothetical protein